MQTQTTYSFDNKIAKEQVRGVEQDDHVNEYKKFNFDVFEAK
jgi:hypothetical protein